MNDFYANQYDILATGKDDDCANANQLYDSVGTDDKENDKNMDRNCLFTLHC